MEHDLLQDYRTISSLSAKTVLKPPTNTRGGSVIREKTGTHTRKFYFFETFQTGMTGLSYHRFHELQWGAQTHRYKSSVLWYLHVEREKIQDRLDESLTFRSWQHDRSTSTLPTQTFFRDPRPHRPERNGYAQDGESRYCCTHSKHHLPFSQLPDPCCAPADSPPNCRAGPALPAPHCAPTKLARSLRAL